MQDCITKQYLSLKASAGSGKTFMLTLRYIYLLLLGAKPREILAITFTIKAQREMYNRIHIALRELANVSIDSKYFKKLLDLGLDEESIKKNATLAYERFKTSHNKIMTFDAFFNSILKKFSFYVGINNYNLGNFTLEEEKVLNSLLQSLDNEELNFLAKFCSQSDLDFNKLLNMFDNVNNVNITALDISTFKSKNQWYSELRGLYFELKDYVLNLIFDKKNTKRLHSKFDFELLENFNIKNIAKLIDGIIAPSLDSNTQTIKSLSKLNYDAEFYHTRIEKMRILLCEYFKAIESSVINKLCDYYHLYREHKLKILRSDNNLSFSDVSLLCLDLLSNHIDRDFFYFRLDSKIKHILIDEFQDTNIIQYSILRPLFLEIQSKAENIRNGSIFFVGDEKQAIYRFRGSDSALFDAITKNLSMDVLDLVINFRSSRAVVNFVNSLFSKEYKNINYKNQISNKNIEGYVEVVSKADNNLILECIEERVLFLKENNASDIVILTRANSTAISIAKYLESKNLKISLELKENKNDDIEYLIIENAILYLKHGKKLYLKNCFKLNGEPYSCDRDFDVDLDSSPSEIIYYIMNFFKLHSSMALFILESSFESLNLDDFLVSLSSLDIRTGDAKDCDVCIMNIHNSKGLEFNNVIVAEYKREAIDNDVFYYDYENLKLDSIYYLNKAKYRGIVDDNFQKKIEIKNEIRKYDLCNLLYVAFTRAKETLYVIRSESGGSIFSYLESLENSKYGENKIYSLKPKNSNTSSIPMYIEPKFFGKQEDFIKEESNSKINFSLKSRIKGLAMHLALENCLKYKNKDNLESILLNNFGFILNKSDIDSVLHSTHKILDNEVILNILKDSIDIKCEVSFLSEENKLMRIDCLIFTHNNLYVLDYKSSTLNLEEKKNQIRKYANFIKNNFHKNVVAYLCFQDGSLLKVE